MSQSIWARTRSSSTALYILAGVLTWPVVTLLIYWGDRFANGMTGGMNGPGAPQAGISFWAAGGYSLVLSLLILIAGWLQSSHRS